MEERRNQLQAGKAQLPTCPKRKGGRETRKPPRQPTQKSIVESPHVGSRLSGQGQPAALARNSADVGPHIDNADAWNEQALDVPDESRIESSRRQIGQDHQLAPERSEEHTSELQSLMRISYAVFCLKKKKKKLDYSITGYHTSTYTT